MNASQFTECLQYSQLSEEYSFNQVFSNLLGIKYMKPHYHPCANEVVECFQRQLKAALDKTDWISILLLVLLFIRNLIKEDISCSPAEIIFSKSLNWSGYKFYFWQHSFKNKNNVNITFYTTAEYHQKSIFTMWSQYLWMYIYKKWILEETFSSQLYWSIQSRLQSKKIIRSYKDWKTWQYSYQ